MDLYADTYGLTRLRLLVALLRGVVRARCSCWCWSPGPAPGAVAAPGWRSRAGVLALLGLAAANPDRLIAERNMPARADRHDRPGLPGRPVAGRGAGARPGWTRPGATACSAGSARGWPTAGRLAGLEPRPPAGPDTDRLPADRSRRMPIRATALDIARAAARLPGMTGDRRTTPPPAYPGGAGRGRGPAAAPPTAPAPTSPSRRRSVRRWSRAWSGPSSRSPCGCRWWW